MTPVVRDPAHGRKTLPPPPTIGTNPHAIVLLTTETVRDGCIPFQ